MGKPGSIGSGSARGGSKSPNTPPVAVFTGPSTTQAGDQWLVNGSASYDPDGTIKSWTIVWGDGLTDSGRGVPPLVSHAYASAGTFTAVLTVKDSRNQTDSAEIVVTVAAAETACSYSLSPTSANVPAAGGQVAFTITAPASCAWTAGASPSWTTVSPTSGSGNGTVTATVGASVISSARVNTVTIGGQVAQITQAGVVQTPPPTPDTYSVSPSTLNFAAAGGSQTFTLTASSGAAWTCADNQSYLSVSPTSGTGSATITVTATANAGALRTGTVTVTGSTSSPSVSISQAAPVATPPDPCTYSASPSSLTVPSTGGSGTITVTTGAGCAWTATEALSYLTLSRSSGTGPGTLQYTCSANSGSQRVGTFTVAGTLITLTQAAAPPPTCTYTLNGSSANVSASGGTGTITLVTGVGCAWTATSDASWATLSVASGTGQTSIGYTISANTGNARTAILTIGGQTFTILQAAVAPPVCTYVLSPTSASVAAAGGNGNITITTQTGCAWTASDNASWLSLDQTTGTGTDTIQWTAAANSGAARSGIITINSRQFTVAQGATGGTTQPVWFRADFSDQHANGTDHYNFDYVYSGGLAAGYWDVETLATGGYDGGPCAHITYSIDDDEYTFGWFKSLMSNPAVSFSLGDGFYVRASFRLDNGYRWGTGGNKENKFFMFGGHSNQSLPSRPLILWERPTSVFGCTLGADPANPGVGTAPTDFGLAESDWEDPAIQGLYGSVSVHVNISTECAGPSPISDAANSITPGPNSSMPVDGWYHGQWYIKSGNGNALFKQWINNNDVNNPTYASPTDLTLGVDGWGTNAQGTDGSGGFNVGGYFQGPGFANGYRLRRFEIGPTFDASWKP